MEMENKTNIFSCIYFSPDVSNETIEKLKNDPVVDVLESHETEEGDKEFTLGHPIGHFKVIVDEDVDDDDVDDVVRIFEIAKANNAKVDIMCLIEDGPGLNHLYYYLEKRMGSTKKN